MSHPDHSKEITRIKRIIGQLEGVQRMIEDGQYCINILNQTKAISSAVHSLEAALLDKHLQHCVGRNVQHSNEKDQDQKIEEPDDFIWKRRSKIPYPGRTSDQQGNHSNNESCTQNDQPTDGNTVIRNTNLKSPQVQSHARPLPSTLNDTCKNHLHRHHPRYIRLCRPSIDNNRNCLRRRSRVLRLETMMMPPIGIENAPIV